MHCASTCCFWFDCFDWSPAETGGSPIEALAASTSRQLENTTNQYVPIYSVLYTSGKPMWQYTPRENQCCDIHLQKTNVPIYTPRENQCGHIHHKPMCRYTPREWECVSNRARELECASNRALQKQTIGSSKVTASSKYWHFKAQNQTSELSFCNSVSNEIFCQSI